MKSNPKILIHFDSGELSTKIKLNNKMINEIMVNLEIYLSSIRSVFPRFHFISNDELLNLLSETKNIS